RARQPRRLRARPVAGRRGLDRGVRHPAARPPGRPRRLGGVGDARVGERTPLGGRRRPAGGRRRHPLGRDRARSPAGPAGGEVLAARRATARRADGSPRRRRAVRARRRPRAPRTPQSPRAAVRGALVPGSGARALPGPALARLTVDRYPWPAVVPLGRAAGRTLPGGGPCLAEWAELVARAGPVRVPRAPAVV